MVAVPVYIPSSSEWVWCLLKSTFAILEEWPAAPVVLAQEGGARGLPSTLAFYREVERLREVEGRSRVGTLLLTSCPVLAHLCQQGSLFLLSPWLQVRKLRFREVESLTRKERVTVWLFKPRSTE